MGANAAAAEKGKRMAGITSKYIHIPGMNNTRDLGGMRTKDGRTVRPNMLYRSSKLSKLEDRDWFTRNVALVVDMRSSREINENPDPQVPGVDYLHLPIFEMQAVGVSRDRESDRRAAPLDMETAIKSMSSVYARFVNDEFCLYQYRRFIRLLFEPREKALLWHCSAGKDRTGTGALFILELLGVDREDILADYLMTNEYLKDEIREFVDRAAERSGGMDDAAREALTVLMGAHERYPLTVYEAAEARYGSFDAFLREGLGVSDDEREELRRRYLE
jgi:protein-tyrosine phosphatase